MDEQSQEQKDQDQQQDQERTLGEQMGETTQDRDQNQPSMSERGEKEQVAIAADDPTNQQASNWPTQSERKQEPPAVPNPEELQPPPGRHDLPTPRQQAAQPQTWDPTIPGMEKEADWKPQSLTETKGEVVDSRERAAMPLGKPNTPGRNPNVHSETPRDLPRRGENKGTGELSLDEELMGAGAPSRHRAGQSEEDRAQQERSKSEVTHGDVEVDRFKDRTENISANERRQEQESRNPAAHEERKKQEANT